MLHPRFSRLCASLAAVITLAACDSGVSGGDHYLSPRLRAAVDELKSETGSAPPFVRLPVTIPGQKVRLELGDLRRGRLERALPADGYPDDGITLRRIITDGERDVEFSYTDEREPRGGDYYYVRVRQVNDAMAWSSPVWVGGYPSR